MMSRRPHCVSFLNSATVMLFVLAILAGLPIAEASEKTVKPNVVFILADDLGWSDTTLFGTTTFYKTPNVERLAARG